MLTLLRKLGILRYGTKNYTYTNGQDMPAKALMDDVYDEEKDLVNRQDVERAGEALHTSKGKILLKWVILCIVGFLAGCFVLGMFFGTNESPREENVAASQAESAAAIAAGPVGTKMRPTPPVTDEDEINRVFFGVRQANLDEDIEAFMKYYTRDFPDRSGKERKTLETWQKFDFLSLDFFVFDLQVDGSSAQASLGWEIALLEKGASEPQLIETTNQVVLEQGGAGWQIVSLQ